MPIQPQSAARTMVSDIAPIVDAGQQAGTPIEACIFLGSSPIRQYAEGWGLDTLLKLTCDSVTFAVANGLPVMFVTEDTTRARPETLRAVYTEAMRCGARRLCLADTVGHATPDGVRALVRLVAHVRDEVDPTVGIDWHGHKDRGLDIINTLAAIEAGADRVHACALGIGERSGTTPMGHLRVNLKLLGWNPGVEVGPMSGEHNVRFWLRNHEIEEHPVYIEKILAAAKRATKILSDDEIRRMVTVLHQRLKQGEEVTDEELEMAF